MAEAMGPGDGGPTLRRWLCQLVNDGRRDVDPATLDAAQSVALLLIFDGLDEVTHMSLRHRVIRRDHGVRRRATPTMPTCSSS